MSPRERLDRWCTPSRMPSRCFPMGATRMQRSSCRSSARSAQYSDAHIYGQSNSSGSAGIGSSAGGGGEDTTAFTPNSGTSGRWVPTSCCLCVSAPPFFLRIWETRCSFPKPRNHCGKSHADTDLCAPAPLTVPVLGVARGAGNRYRSTAGLQEVVGPKKVCSEKSVSHTH